MVWRQSLRSDQAADLKTREMYGVKCNCVLRHLPVSRLGPDKN